ncbi:hypothetical protein Taro_009103 [Colocasia esculenta]|uniref:Uncharacterized protein n=1 Tax=Colocasia esculenta TaxID=4460 RepID=A0A843U3V7_COLES|nr:hypothetical protein [Colocasia esculenta]
MSFHHVLGAVGLKPKAAPPFPLSPSPLSFFPSPSLRALLPFSQRFLVLVVFELRRCRPVRAGDVAVSFRARRRCPFLREGPNRFVLRVEIETLDPLALSMLPSPSKSWFLYGLGLGSVRTPCSRLSEVSLRVQIHSFTRCSTLEGLSHKRGCYRCLGPPSSGTFMGGIGTTTVLELAAQQADSGAQRKTAESPPSVFASRVVVTTSSHTEFPTVCTFRAVLVVVSLPQFRFVGETSQQRQGAHRVDETER